jgi:hypothetical protein
MGSPKMHTCAIKNPAPGAGAGHIWLFRILITYACKS